LATHTIEPRRERGLPGLPRIRAAPQHDEDVLGNIVGVCGFAAKGEREAAHFLAMTAHEDGEGAAIFVGNPRK
jgi:hypothetical protein